MGHAVAHAQATKVHAPTSTHYRYVENYPDNDIGRDTESYIKKYRQNHVRSHIENHADNYPEKVSYYREKTKILFVTPEFSALVKAGGLGDVSAALPEALSGQHDIRVLIPGYRDVLASDYDIEIVGEVDAYAAIPACAIGKMKIANGVVVYVLLCDELYAREGSPYGDKHGNDWADNHIRFARLGLAAAQIAENSAVLDWCPDLVHAHDWPAALAPAYMAWRGQKTPSVFTIHNLAHQGLYDFSCSTELGLPPEVFGMESMEFYGKLSFLKAGIVYANQVTTVSKTYAREITTPAFGCGLEGLLTLKFNQGLLSGITNGIDESWQPASDPYLTTGFCANQWQHKHDNVRYVEDMFDLDASNGPLFVVISRLVHQKGIDLTLAIADDIVAAGGRIAIIGRGDAMLESALRELARRHKGSVGVHIGFNEGDARRMFAASDFLLMPSRFEPCGLSQMYAQRYGSLPIARHTGGLADTIDDGINGFLFHEETVESYGQAVRRALQVFNSPSLLDAMRCHAMDAPLYWQHSVQPYHRLYQSLVRDNVVAHEVAHGNATYIHRNNHHNNHHNNLHTNYHNHHHTHDHNSEHRQREARA